MRAVAQAALSAFLVSLLSGCGSADSRLHAVRIHNFVFEPAEVQAEVGDTIVWTNEDVVEHTATAKGVFDSGVIPASGTWRTVVDRKGELKYLCSLHPVMKGTIVVR